MSRLLSVEGTSEGAGSILGAAGAGAGGGAPVGAGLRFSCLLLLLATALRVLLGRAVLAGVRPVKAASAAVSCAGASAPSLK